MEQNLVSDEELIERINKVLSESNQHKKKPVAENRLEEASNEKFHDVYETTEQENAAEEAGEAKVLSHEKNLVLENHYLSLQLQAEKKKAKELQSKFKLFENSIKYFERLSGQLENIKRAVDDENFEVIRGEAGHCNSEAMQKIRPKNIHTAASGVMSTVADDPANETNQTHAEEPGKLKEKEDKEEVAFRDAEDFKQLEQGLEIVKDKNGDVDSEQEKVYITKTEKRCLEDIGSIASRTRAPLDDKHQKFFERDRRKFANSIVMPEIQEVEKTEVVPPEIISKTKETPVNITSTELDGLRSYLLQLKELIARRETAWARTTERDYNQRVEITRFKNEVTHLRMLCEKRQKDIKDRDQIIVLKDEEIRDLQKRVQSLQNALPKQEKKDEKIIDTIDGQGSEALENSQIVQRSYNAMKRQSLMTRANMSSTMNMPVKPINMTPIKPQSVGRDAANKKPKTLMEKAALRMKASDSTSNDEDGKSWLDKSRPKNLGKERAKSQQRKDALHKTKETYEKVDEKLQRVEEMLHREVLKGTKKPLPIGKVGKNQIEIKSLIKNHSLEKNPTDFPLSSVKKLTPSNSKIRQEMLTAMTGLNSNPNLGLRPKNFPDLKKTQANAASIVNALLATRNSNLYSY